MGAPYIFEDIEYFLQHGKEKLRTEEDILAIFKTHFGYICDYAEDRKALLDTRRVASWYLKTLPSAKDLKEKVFSTKDFEELKIFINNYSLSN